MFDNPSSYKSTHSTIIWLLHWIPMLPLSKGLSVTWPCACLSRFQTQGSCVGYCCVFLGPRGRPIGPNPLVTSGHYLISRNVIPCWNMPCCHLKVKTTMGLIVSFMFHRVSYITYIWAHCVLSACVNVAGSPYMSCSTSFPFLSGVICFCSNLTGSSSFPSLFMLVKAEI